LGVLIDGQGFAFEYDKDGVILHDVRWVAKTFDYLLRRLAFV